MKNVPNSPGLPYCSLLTREEELSLVRFLKNRSRCMQGISETEASDLVVKILKTRQQVNKTESVLLPHAQDKVSRVEDEGAEESGD